MGLESSGVVRFDFGPLLQDQMRVAKLKSAYNLRTLTFDYTEPSVLAQLLTGFCELSFQWIPFYWFSNALGLVFSCSVFPTPVQSGAAAFCRTTKRMPHKSFLPFYFLFS